MLWVGWFGFNGGSALTGVFVASRFGGIGYRSGIDLVRQVAVQALGVAAVVL